MNKQMRISAVHHLIAGVIPACQWVASIVGVGEVVGKDGTKVEVEVNAEEGELEQELRLAEPLLWESEFPPEAEKKGMMKEMQSMKDFDVYDEVPVKDCTDEQINEALDCRWSRYGRMRPTSDAELLFVVAFRMLRRLRKTTSLHPHLHW